MLNTEYERRIIERSFSYIADFYNRKLKDRGLSFDDVEYFQCWPLPDLSPGQPIPDLSSSDPFQVVIIHEWRFVLFWQLKNGQTINSHVLFYGRDCPIGDLWNNNPTA